MNKCKTCKFWTKPESEYGEVPGVGRCTAMVMFWDATEWVEDSDFRQLKPQYKQALAFVQDGSDYYAALKTLPDFGCILHESIEGVTNETN